MKSSYFLDITSAFLPSLIIFFFSPLWGQVGREDLGSVEYFRNPYAGKGLHLYTVSSPL